MNMVNIIPAKHQHVSMLMLALLAQKHSRVSMQPHRAASMTTDSESGLSLFLVLPQRLRSILGFDQI